VGIKTTSLLPILPARSYRILSIAMPTRPRRLTHQPMVFTAERVPRLLRDRWYVASRFLGVSQSAFLRTALRERVERVLREKIESEDEDAGG
jgi:hypothetical protein